MKRNENVNIFFLNGHGFARAPQREELEFYRDRAKNKNIKIKIITELILIFFFFHY